MCEGTAGGHELKTAMSPPGCTSWMPFEAERARDMRHPRGLNSPRYRPETAGGVREKEKKMVGVGRFELPTSRSRTEHSSLAELHPEAEAW